VGGGGGGGSVSAFGVGGAGTASGTAPHVVGGSARSSPASAADAIVHDRKRAERRSVRAGTARWRSMLRVGLGVGMGGARGGGLVRSLGSSGDTRERRELDPEATGAVDLGYEEGIGCAERLAVGKGAVDAEVLVGLHQRLEREKPPFDEVAS